MGEMFLSDNGFYNFLNDKDKKSLRVLTERYIDYLDSIQAQRIADEVDSKKQKTYSHEEVGKRLGLIWKRLFIVMKH